MIEGEGIVEGETNILSELIAILIFIFLQFFLNGSQIHGVVDDGEVVGNIQLDRIHRF